MTKYLSFFLLFFSSATALPFHVPQASSRIQQEAYMEKVSLWKSNDETKRLKFSAFDTDFDLPLEETETIFAEDFKFLSTTDGDTQLIEYPTDKKANQGSFYSVKDSTGSVYVEEGENGLHVEGIVDDDLRLISFNDPSADGFIEHRALKLHPQFPEKELFDYDYTIPNVSKVANQFPKPKIGDTAWIEVFVVFDYKNSATLEFDMNKIYKYLGTFWNSVQRHYSVFQQPRIKFVISKVFITLKEKEEPFLQNFKMNNNQVDGTKSLDAFGQWLYTHREVSFDIAILHTGLNLVMKTPHSSGNLLGRAFVSSVCAKDDYRKMMWNCGEGEDTAPLYTGVLTITHEIGHLLNAEHDGSGSGTLCQDKGYIMSPQRGGKSINAYKFSSCAQQSIKQYLRSSSSYCVWNIPRKTKIPLNGKPWIQPLQICIWRYGHDSFPYKKQGNNLCEELLCKRRSDNAIFSYSQPPEGTLCDNNSVCYEGFCRNLNVLNLLPWMKKV